MQREETPDSGSSGQQPIGKREGIRRSRAGSFPLSVPCLHSGRPCRMAGPGPGAGSSGTAFSFPLRQRRRLPASPGGPGPGIPRPAGSTPVIQKPGGVSASGLSHSRSCRPHDSVLSPRAVLPAASGAFMRAAGLQGSGPEGRGSLPCRSLSRGLKTSGSADFPAVPRPQPAASAASGRFSPCVEWSCLIRRIRSIADILLSPCSVSLLAQQSRDSGPGFSLPWIFSGLIGKTGILFFDLPEKPGGCRAPGDAAAASCRIILLQTPRFLISNARQICRSRRRRGAAVALAGLPDRAFQPPCLLQTCRTAGCKKRTGGQNAHLFHTGFHPSYFRFFSIFLTGSPSVPPCPSSSGVFRCSGTAAMGQGPGLRPVLAALVAVLFQQVQNVVVHGILIVARPGDIGHIEVIFHLAQNIQDGHEGRQIRAGLAA